MVVQADLVWLQRYLVLMTVCNYALRTNELIRRVAAYVPKIELLRAQLAELRSSGFIELRYPGLVTYYAITFDGYMEYLRMGTETEKLKAALDYCQVAGAME